MSALPEAQSRGTRLVRAVMSLCLVIALLVAGGLSATSRAGNSGARKFESVIV
jgi:hypothetical protein